MNPSRATRAGAVLCLAGTIGFLAGCPHRPPELSPADRIQEPGDLIAAVRERGGKLTSMRGSGTVDMRRGQKRVKAHMVVAIRRPADLRFETESFFDQPLSILVTDGMEFSVWDMDQGRFVQGPATPANISQVIPIPMDGPEVSGIVLGDPPLIPFARSELAWQDGTYRLVLTTPRMRQEIVVNARRLRPDRVVCHAGGRLLYELTYEDWHDRDGGIHIPRKIRFEMPSENIRLIMKIRKAEANVELEDRLFILQPPEGMVVERVES